MRVHRIAGLALSMGMLVLNMPMAFADASATPSPASTSSFDAAILQYKIEMGKYRAQMLERDRIRREITQRFMTAIIQANKIAKSGLGTATTPEAKSTIIGLQKNSVTLAVIARDSAILSIDPEPIQPVKPVKPEVLRVKTKTNPGKPSPSP